VPISLVIHILDHSLPSIPFQEIFLEVLPMRFDGSDAMMLIQIVHIPEVEKSDKATHHYEDDNHTYEDSYGKGVPLRRRILDFGRLVDCWDGSEGKQKKGEEKANAIQSLHSLIGDL
jgi:hypothetical protein